jgi:predicted helicase
LPHENSHIGLVSFFAANSIVDKDSVSPLDNVTFFPLYLYPDTSKASLWDEAHPLPNTPGGRSPNLTQGFVDDISARIGLEWVADGKGSREAGTFGPEDVFDYMYAIFHSPEYRERYAEFLKTDFPRLPLTRDADLFWSLCHLGDQLVKLHLMERHAPAITRYPAKGDDTVEKVRYTAPGEGDSGSPPSLGEGPGERAGRVWINASQYFEGVPPEVWEFHVGGYQVCEKWLKDRKGRTLTYDDLTHYQRTVAALAETIRLMAAIDEVIENHGGWPLDGERS